MTAWYECCGEWFPDALGKYGCPICCGEKVARYRTAPATPQPEHTEVQYAEQA